jgi:hypothetical protein
MHMHNDNAAVGTVLSVSRVDCGVVRQQQLQDLDATIIGGLV